MASEWSLVMPSGVWLGVMSSGMPPIKAEMSYSVLCRAGPAQGEGERGAISLQHPLITGSTNSFSPPPRGPHPTAGFPTLFASRGYCSTRSRSPFFLSSVAALLLRLLISGWSVVFRAGWGRSSISISTGSPHLLSLSSETFFSPPFFSSTTPSRNFISA